MLRLRSRSIKDALGSLFPTQRKAHLSLRAVLLTSSTTMARFQSLLSSIALLLISSAYAGIGPATDLTISNADISPDGFTRAAVVVNGVFPGPLITGNMVCVVHNLP